MQTSLGDVGMLVHFASSSSVTNWNVQVAANEPSSPPQAAAVQLLPLPLMCFDLSV
jgi:hypothetical protein